MADNAVLAMLPHPGRVEEEVQRLSEELLLLQKLVQAGGMGADAARAAHIIAEKLAMLTDMATRGDKAEQGLEIQRRLSSGENATSIIPLVEQHLFLGWVTYEEGDAEGRDDYRGQVKRGGGLPSQWSSAQGGAL